MLAGYLPFDDDPANPEGDNINLLYKYIVSTPLIFPEYVTPHARDLLKRILVPNPRERADLFEIARHSWLSEYSHVVGLITSNTASTANDTKTEVPSGLSYGINGVDNSLMALDRAFETPTLARSASVREPTTKSHPTRSTVVVGGLSQKPGHVDQTEAEKAKAARNTKRRTVQVEYVAPQSPITRTEQIKTLPPADEEAEPDLAGDSYNQAAAATPVEPSIRPVRDTKRAASENVVQNSNPFYTLQRPSTGGSISGVTRVVSSTYSQPAAGVVAMEEAQGRFSQPRLASYSGEEGQSQPGDRRSYILPDDLSHSQGFPQTISVVPGNKRAQGHKRSSTLSGLGEKLGFGKRGSLFGSSRTNVENDEPAEKPAEKPAKKNKKYPPVSMSRPIPNDNSAASSGVDVRRSTESSRRTSFSFGRKSSRNTEPLDPSLPSAVPDQTSKRSSRRFSLIPSFARSSNVSKDDVAPKKADNRPRMAFGRGESRSSSRSTTDSNIPGVYDPTLDRSVPRKPVPAPTSAPRYEQPVVAPSDIDNDGVNNGANGSDEDDQHNMPIVPPGSAGFDSHNQFGDSYRDVKLRESSSRPTSSKPGVLHKKRENRFNEAYEQESSHAGSSGAARRVMAIFNFRRRAKA
jgi:protein-serine/threonine kinase